MTDKNFYEHNILALELASPKQVSFMLDEEEKFLAIEIVALKQALKDAQHNTLPAT